MEAQILSSLAAGAFLVVAAVMLNSPVSVLLLSLCCMIAWVSHISTLSYGLRVIVTYVGLGLGVLIWLYLLSLSLGVF
jgi:hypothetical protein